MIGESLLSASGIAVTVAVLSGLLLMFPVGWVIRKVDPRGRSAVLTLFATATLPVLLGLIWSGIVPVRFSGGFRTIVESGSRSAAVADERTPTAQQNSTTNGTTLQPERARDAVSTSRTMGIASGPAGRPRIQSNGPGALWLRTGLISYFVVAAVGFAWRVYAMARHLNRSEKGLEVILARARAIAEECAKTLGMGMVPTICVTSSRQAPMVAGLVRPQVVVPAAVEDWSDDELEMSLLHEMVHIARRHALVLLFFELVASPLPWHPFTRLLRRRLSLELEARTDRDVSQAVGRPSHYAGWLLRLAAGAQTGVVRPLAMRSQLRARIERLSETRRSAMFQHRKNRSAIMLLGGAGLLLLWFAIPAVAEPSNHAAEVTVGTDAVIAQVRSVDRMRMFSDGRSVQVRNATVFRFDGQITRIAYLVDGEEPSVEEVPFVDTDGGVIVLPGVGDRDPYGAGLILVVALGDSRGSPGPSTTRNAIVFGDAGNPATVELIRALSVTSEASESFRPLSSIVSATVSGAGYSEMVAMLDLIRLYEITDRMVGEFGSSFTGFTTLFERSIDFTLTGAQDRSAVVLPARSEGYSGSGFNPSELDDSVGTYSNTSTVRRYSDHTGETTLSSYPAGSGSFEVVPVSSTTQAFVFYRYAPDVERETVLVEVE